MSDTADLAEARRRLRPDPGPLWVFRADFFEGSADQMVCQITSTKDETRPAATLRSQADKLIKAAQAMLRDAEGIERVHGRPFAVLKLYEEGVESLAISSVLLDVPHPVVVERLNQARKLLIEARAVVTLG